MTISKTDDYGYYAEKLPLKIEDMEVFRKTCDSMKIDLQKLMVRYVTNLARKKGHKAYIRGNKVHVKI